MRKRATGIIIKDRKILVFHRFRKGRWYYSFPGGGIEAGESEEQAMIREIKEELSLDVEEYSFLFSVETKLDKSYFFELDETFPRIDKYSPLQYFYLITKYSGVPVLGESEKERQNENNKYIIEWISLSEIKQCENLFPVEGREKLMRYIDQGKIPL